MSRVDCHQLDERLMDYLYEEMGTREMDEMRAHVEGCPRCSAEVGRFRGVRRAVAQLEMAEPPPAVSAKLLHQAASVRQHSMWRRSRAVRMAVYATPIVAMAAAFVLLIHVKERALSPAIHPGDVTVTIDGKKTAETTAAAAPADDRDKAGEESGAATPTEKAPAPPKAALATDPETAERGRLEGRLERKVELKPPVTKDTKLGKAMHADSSSAHRGAGATTGAPATPRGGEGFQSAVGGTAGGRRDEGGGKRAGGAKVGGDVAAAEPLARNAPASKLVSKPVSKPIELAKKEAPRPVAPSLQPAPAAPPPAPSPMPSQARPQSQAWGAPQVTTSPPPARVNVESEGYRKRYANAPGQQPQQQPPAANAEAPELDETRAKTQGLVAQTRREEQKQATTPPEQLYSQLVTTTNEGRDCGKVMDLVKQLESWNYWGNLHPNEMKNAYQLRARCQPDYNLANKDYENVQRITVEQEKNDKQRASKAGNKRAPAKSKASDNAASAPAEAAPAKK